MIRLLDITKKYGSALIYKHLNYTFPNKGLICFLGPSGSGKTTLLNLLAGFDTDYEGEIQYGDFSLNHCSLDKLCEYRYQNIGFVFQNYNLQKGYTVAENVIMGMHLNPALTEDEKHTKAENVLKQIELFDKVDQPIDHLSGGQKQRAAIARALMNDPDIILADEPTGALDENTTATIMEHIKSIAEEKTVIVITHDENVAEYADEVIYLEDNKIKILRKDPDDSMGHDNQAIKKKDNAQKPQLKSAIAWKLGAKNFKIHFCKFLIAVVLLAFGSSAFICSLCAQGIVSSAIQDFQNKNAFYAKGTVTGEKQELQDAFDIVESTEGIDHLYYQYDMENISVQFGDKNQTLETKQPTILSSVSMIYGNMPNDENAEIALSVSLAAKLHAQVNELIGKEVKFSYTDSNGMVHEINLTVSGISNDQFDNFTVSERVEQQIYADTKADNAKMISYRVAEFSNIPIVTEKLQEKGLNIQTKAGEVSSFKKSFEGTLNLFSVLSAFILVVFVLIGIAIIFKISVERYTEIGILSSLGYTKRNIKKIFFRESLLLGSITAVASIVFCSVFRVLYEWQFGYNLDITVVTYLLLILLNVFLSMVITHIINLKLINTEVSYALNH